MNRIKHVYAAIVLISLTACAAASAADLKDNVTHEVAMVALYGGASATIKNGRWFFGDPQFRKAGGGGLSYRYYVTQHVALNVGIGMLGKGFRARRVVDSWPGGIETSQWVGYTCAEIPLGIHFRIASVHVGLDLVTTFVVTEFLKETEGEQTRMTTNLDLFSLRRNNFCPRVSLALAIPMGGIALISGVMAEMDIMNNATEDEISATYRHLNIMGSLGVLFGY